MKMSVNTDVSQFCPQEGVEPSSLSVQEQTDLRFLDVEHPSPWKGSEAP